MLEFDAGVIGRELPIGLGVVFVTVRMSSKSFVGGHGQPPSAPAT
jgi:hypothetical protein